MKIAIIGAGAMGSALAEGLLKGSVFKPEEIVIANPHQEKLKKFAQFGMQTTTDNCAAVKGAQLVAIVVKPWLVEQVINEIKGVLDYQQQTIMNMAAAISSDTLFSWLEKDGKRRRWKRCRYSIVPRRFTSLCTRRYKILISKKAGF